MEVRPAVSCNFYNPVEELRGKGERDAAVACSMLMAATEAIAGIP